MSHLIADTPITECLVRREMFSTRGAPVPGYIFGFAGRANQAPAFQVMTEHGAQWARVPLHLLCWKPCEALPLFKLCWWDCFSDDFSVHAFDFLRGHACSCIDRAGQAMRGTYLFTVEWRGRWAEIPDQHKQHHMVKLTSGHFAMYPNNKISWQDGSWIRGMRAPGGKGWRTNNRSWSVEGT